MSGKQKLNPVSSTTGADSVDMLSQRRFCFKVKFIFFCSQATQPPLNAVQERKTLLNYTCQSASFGQHPVFTDH